MKEIGGYFEFEQLISNEYYKNLIPLNNGRNALLYLIRAKYIKKLYIPSYLCDVISDMLRKNNCNFEYYNISTEFMPVFDKQLKDGEYLYVVNYYGQLTNEIITTIKGNYGNIILDYTHAFFQKPMSGIDTIYTCRKFFGVPDGAYLSTDTILNDNLDKDISKDRMIHLLGRYEGTASEYYNSFKKIDESFRNEPVKYMSKLTHNILGAINYDKIRQVRNENYGYLERQLGEKNKLKLVFPDGPFAYPYYIKNGIEVRKQLALKKIYIPTLWPNVLRDISEGSIEYDYASNILPLPCDQRYKISDLNIMVEEIQKCLY